MASRSSATTTRCDHETCSEHTQAAREEAGVDLIEGHYACALAYGRFAIEPFLRNQKGSCVASSGNNEKSRSRLSRRSTPWATQIAAIRAS